MFRSVFLKYRTTSPSRLSSTGCWKNIGSFSSRSWRRQRWRCLQIKVREPIRKEESRRVRRILPHHQNSTENAIIAASVAQGGSVLNQAPRIEAREEQER